ncbi:MAG TPA: hypothetical protein VGW09_07260, partial [Nitrososphaeraceae archaeon]|nr:hypothetical protein [Nitrososphaeraceae archaeon]
MLFIRIFIADKLTQSMKPLPLNPGEKISHHIDALFGVGVSSALPIEKIQFEYSRRTGRIKTFSLENRLIATLRT